MQQESPPKVFIGLTEIAGYYTMLQQGFRELGIESCFISYSGDPLAYGGASENAVARLVKLARAKRGEYRDYWFMRKLWRVVDSLSNLFLFLWALFKFDIFIFGFATSFFEFRELPVLRFFGKKMIFVFHGSDSRPAYIDGAIFSNSEVAPREIMETARTQKTKIKTIEKYADFLISTPPQALFHERPFVMFPIVGACSKAMNFSGKHPPAPKNDGLIRVLHAPSNSSAKGTAEIQAAIKKSQEAGLKIEFVMISGQPNSVVIDELSKCDFVIDQFYSDIGMPGFATEAAWFGKPVLIAGYSAEKWKTWLRSDLIPPTCYCLPEEFENALRRLVEDHAFREDLGRKARRFVEEHWTPSKVAQRFIEIAGGSAPLDWMYDPGKIDYIEGCGISRSKLKTRLRNLLSAYGSSSLFLSDKPSLVEKIEEFANSPDSC